MVIASNEKIIKLDDEIDALKVSNQPRMENWLDLLPNEVLSHISSFLVKSELLICIGGFHGDCLKSSEYLLDTKWKPFPDMLAPRCSFNAVVIENVINVMGGRDENETVSTMESFDFQSTNWLPQRQMNIARYNCAAAAVQVGNVDNILVSGGQNSEYEIIQTAELFNPRQENWTMVADMRERRTAH